VILSFIFFETAKERRENIKKAREKQGQRGRKKGKDCAKRR
jgi:hypothetical protein